MTTPPSYQENSEISVIVNCPERPTSNPPIQIMTLSNNHPVPYVCPYCHKSIITRVEKSNGLAVWLAATGICLLGCAVGCCLIPFFIDDLKNTTHYCPNCNKIIGQNKKI